MTCYTGRIYVTVEAEDQQEAAKKIGRLLRDPDFPIELTLTHEEKVAL